MSYIRSLRFKLMLLCIVPLLSCAFLFIGHSVIIAHQVRQAAAETYVGAVAQSDSLETAVQAVRNTTVGLGWIAKQWTIVFLILFVCFYIPITINIARFIKPIRKLAGYSDSLAKGDSQIEIVKDRTDELGTLQASFRELVNVSRRQAEIIQSIAKGDISGTYTPLSEADVVGHSIVRMLEGNNAMMANLSAASQQMAVVSAQIAESSQLLASGSAQQASAIDELSGTIDEIAKIPHESLKLAGKAMTLSDSIKENAENGTRQMENMVRAVNEIRDASNGIQKVIKVIDDIAFQTNILALNAAVEAARAGQHGKGFAVVAEEVRSLASKSAEAAKDTSEMISDSVEKAALGVTIAAQTQKFIEVIVSGINESNDILEDIAKLSSGQDVSISGISNSVKQMADVVQSNSAMAEQYASTSEEMKGQTDAILDMVSEFILNPSLAGRTIRPQLPGHGGN